MLGPDDLVDLGASLRAAGFRVATQQFMAAQQLLLRLAADGALPPTRDALEPLLAPIFCTSAPEQRGFELLYRDWLQRRFPEETGPQPPVPPPLPPTQRRTWKSFALAALAVVVIGAAWFAWRRPPVDVVQSEPSATARPQSALASQVSRRSSVESLPPLQRIVRFDAADALPTPTLRQRIVWRNVLFVTLPLLLFLAWQTWRLQLRPSLRRMPTRTPPQLQDVHLSGGVRSLLPGFPVRRLAQELRRRLPVESRELQVEPTIAATMQMGGLFTAVRGSRVEPEYFALVDRASVSDHQALLANDIVAELARSDVLIERYEFDRDATVCRPRSAHARARFQPTRAPGHQAHAAVVELSELRERHPGHRVLMFSDGIRAFDGFTGEPAPWLATLLQWPLPVLLTPLPLKRWGRREWALQQMGVTVLPLSREGCLALMSVLSGVPVDETSESATRATSGLHEHNVRRWLERDPPPQDTVERLCRDLAEDLGVQGFNWLAACAAYPEIHWGITLRLGFSLLPNAGEVEKVLLRLAWLVWFREAYMPDWLRQALLDRLAPDVERRTREILVAMMEAVSSGSTGEIPLPIAIDEPSDGLPLWRLIWNALRRRGLRERSRDMLRKAPADSPMHDYVLLRFLCEQASNKLDLTVSGALPRVLRALPSTISGRTAALAVAMAALIAWRMPPLLPRQAFTYVTGAVGLADEGKRGAFPVYAVPVVNVPASGFPMALMQVDGRTGQWTWRSTVIAGEWMAVSANGNRIVIRRGQSAYVGTVDAPGTLLPLKDSADTIGAQFARGAS
ncbi:hypothetical protein P3T40_000376 [Paraburkholderia sp. EB58]|uniref:hypothetical protein n=1 Tax=Paraburkholderia sp. EB58 TaxID=3035125 RepID=UPI003D1FA8D4